MASVDQPYFIIAGDFNNLDTNFLETEYGLGLITNSITHGKRILDKLFISWPSTYTVRVVNSLLKTIDIKRSQHAPMAKLMSDAAGRQCLSMINDNIILIISDMPWRPMTGH